MKKELTIIILTYNSADIIKECLNRLNFDKYKIVIVDNASKDNTIQVVEDNFKPDKLYKLESNIGFGNGNNIALEDVDTDFAMVLNPDAIIDDENIEIVLDEMKRNEKFALAGPVVLDELPYSEEEYQNRLRKMKGDHDGMKDCYYKEIDNSYFVRFLIGCAMFFKMKDMRKIGFFDKNIFLFHEDDELCFRVKESGYYPVIVKSAKAFHLKGASSKKNLRLLYLREWHYMWSKMYWKQVRKGKLRAKRSSLRRVLVSSFYALCSIITLDREKLIRHVAYINSSFCFILGLGSFRKNGKPRVN